ncbi:lipoyl(octanoyl) transferase LipB [Candidatus Erwinia haradaeae]|uniref:Octanoyltransferase n=1 Tax=Candidatus Erwinia haradaeae TaxID=1922217 RepID=A0A451DA29_9GAMM|nr:lipoyl(octanoyl) transferase LipB [Candidatus Erwinia haradaeae]VFP83115.1 Octanoyltransferase [Candidatus Erwinia haradaeae]
MSLDTLVIRQLGLQDWTSVVFAMQQFTNQRNQMTLDEIWLVEHLPVFTKGQTSTKEPVFMLQNIPVMQSDRGGGITYHGPGQQVLYIMLNLQRRRLSVHQLVSAIEQTVLTTLIHFSVSAHLISGAPGVYIDGKKICSLGLRIRKGCSYHGLALNINMDLTPFLYIHPCGDHQLEMTQLAQQKPDLTLSEVQPVLIRHFTSYLAIKDIFWGNNTSYLGE